MKIKTLVYMSLYLALFSVLNIVSYYIPILRMPNGGSIELGVLALFLASYHLGSKNGVITAVLSVLMQYLTQGLAAPLYIIGVGQFFLDYVLAFGLFGLANSFPNLTFGKFKLYLGVIITYAGRLLTSTLAGVWYWGLPWWGSFIYNLSYNLATMIIILLVLPLIKRNTSDLF